MAITQEERTKLRKEFMQKVASITGNQKDATFFGSNYEQMGATTIAYKGTKKSGDRTKIGEFNDFSGDIKWYNSIPTSPFNEKDWVEITKGAYSGKKGYISSISRMTSRATVEITDKGNSYATSEPWDGLKKINKPKIENGLVISPRTVTLKGEGLNKQIGDEIVLDGTAYKIQTKSGNVAVLVVPKSFMNESFSNGQAKATEAIANKLNKVQNSAAYNEGYEANKSGKATDTRANPYQYDSQEYKDWSRGWRSHQPTSGSSSSGINKLTGQGRDAVRGSGSK